MGVQTSTPQNHSRLQSPSSSTYTKIAVSYEQGHQRNRPYVVSCHILRRTFTRESNNLSPLRRWLPYFSCTYLVRVLTRLCGAPAKKIVGSMASPTFLRDHA